MTTRSVALRLAIGLVAVTALLTWSAPARAACGSLGTNQTLYTNQQLYSCDGRFRVAMQGDGNLVVYEGNTAIWATNRFGSNARLVMQGDGNLVVYDGANRALWASYKYGSNAKLAMQTDGNLVVYDGADRVLWASSVYYRDGVLEEQNNGECMGRCGARCGGWMPFGGGVYTSECMAHDICVRDHGMLYPQCIALIVPAGISYLYTVGRNLISHAWNSIKHFFGW